MRLLSWESQPQAHAANSKSHSLRIPCTATAGLYDCLVVLVVFSIAHVGHAERGQQHNVSLTATGNQLYKHVEKHRWNASPHTLDEHRSVHVDHVRSAAMAPGGAISATNGTAGPNSLKVGQPAQSKQLSEADMEFLQDAAGPLDLDFDNGNRLLRAVEKDRKTSFLDSLVALAGGTGATIGATGVLDLDADLVRRMRVQDKAVMILLVVIYFLILIFSATFAYRQARNNSPVTFYADPRTHDMVAEGQDQQSFLEAFNGSPKDVHLQVSGFVPVPAGILGSVEWNGEHYYDAWSFALDLSPWVVHEGSTDRSSRWDDHLALIEGIVAEDLPMLQYYIMHDRNDLAILELHKEVIWPQSEELATNIKHKIRQDGFGGTISVHRTDTDVVAIYRNTVWANFMHSRMTKVLCALSILGWFVYLPYMWLRCTTVPIRSRYVVDISIQSYWRLIADKLTADGFVERRAPEVEQFRPDNASTHTGGDGQLLQ